MIRSAVFELLLCFDISAFAIREPEQLVLAPPFPEAPCMYICVYVYIYSRYIGLKKI